MKIIQILSHSEDELLGLGDDGNLYTFISPRSPMVKVLLDSGGHSSYYHHKTGTDLQQIAQLQEQGRVRGMEFTHGRTIGWELVATSDYRTKPIAHPLDPKRH